MKTGTQFKDRTLPQGCYRHWAVIKLQGKAESLNNFKKKLATVF